MPSFIYFHFLITTCIFLQDATLLKRLFNRIDQTAKKLPQITITKVNDAKNITSFTRKILQPNAPILSTRQKNN